MEGENVLITTDNINVILDYAKYGIRDSGVAFYIIQPPKHGSITVGSNDIGTMNVDTNSVFSLLDLANDKVLIISFQYRIMKFVFNANIYRFIIFTMAPKTSMIL